MSVYRKFKRNDILYSRVNARPRVTVKYGSTGWTGTTGPSASLSLYAGVRSRFDVKASDIAGSGISVYPIDPVDTHSIDKVIFVSGSYPSTGSIRFVRCRNIPYASFTDVTSERWYDEHFSPIEGLFKYYEKLDRNYFTGSYDFYSPLLLPDDLASGSNELVGPHFIFSGAFAGSGLSSTTASFTAMAWVKPIPLSTASVTPVQFLPTIFSQKNLWSLHIGSGSNVVFRTDAGLIASTGSVRMGEWNNIAVVVSGGVSASIYINSTLDSTQAVPGVLGTGSDLVPLSVGAFISSSGQPARGWSGFIFDTQIWKKTLTQTEIRQYSTGTLTASSSYGLVHYARFNDGPFGTAHGFSSGSGAFDYSTGHAHGGIYSWSAAHRVHWQPCDHPTFRPALKKVNTDISDIRVVHVPSMFYGRQIHPGSVVITDGVYNKRKVVRVFNDDGRGSLYVSGSFTREVSGEDYTGGIRRKVGNVFYTEGLIVLTDPALYDVFDSGSVFWSSEMAASGVFGDLLSVDFRGQSSLHTKTFNCRLPAAQVNASNNPTFSYLDDMGTTAADDDRFVTVREDGTTWITAIGLYNEDRKLIAVAKLAQPIRKREKDRQNIRLKFDF